MNNKITNISFSQKEKLERLFQKNNFFAVYLFGSRVDGRANEKSDYDFGILFEFPFQMEEISLLQLVFEEEASIIGEPRLILSKWQGHKTMLVSGICMAGIHDCDFTQPQQVTIHADGSISVPNYLGVEILSGANV